MNTGLLYKFPAFIVVILCCSCTANHLTKSYESPHHPTDPSISVIPIKLSHTLDIDKETLPKPPKIEQKTHHDTHGMNEKDSEVGNNV